MPRSQLPPELLARIERSAVIAVLVLHRPEDAVPLARALIAGGVDAMELTLRTPVALDALRLIRREVPEMLAGIGTILTPSQADQVRQAGGQFGVAPGINQQVVRSAQHVGLPFAPGVITPTDVETALQLDCRELKLFPAGPLGGLPYLKAMAAPYQHLGVRFIPLGGVNAENMASYLADPLVLAVGGSWLAPERLINSQNWQEISTRAERARTIADQVRPLN